MIAFPSTVAAPEEVSGEYLIFTLGRDSYGLAVERVREIFLAPEITPVVHPPGPMRGTANLKGHAIPVLDFRRRFRFEDEAQRGEGYVIVAEVALPQRGGGGTALVGALVDDVEAVVKIPDAEIAPAPRFGPVHAGHANGVATVHDQATTLLDIDRVVLGENLDDFAWLQGE